MKLLAKIHVTLKPGVNDPQGLAVAGGLRQLGFDGVEGVRAGRYLEVRLDAPDRQAAERAVEEMCRRLLANPVIERYAYELTADDPAPLEAAIEALVEEEA
jgi:phosphoribosylformylglycinamidine synthase PurS subunit